MRVRQAVCMVIAFVILLCLIHLLGRFSTMISWIIIPLTLLLGIIIEEIYLLGKIMVTEIIEGYREKK